MPVKARASLLHYERSKDHRAVTGTNLRLEATVIREPVRTQALSVFEAALPVTACEDARASRTHPGERRYRSW